MTAQIVNLTIGREFQKDGTPTESRACRPCWVLRLSDGQTIGGYRTEQTARMAAASRGALIVATEPPEWRDRQREMCHEANRQAAKRRWEKERRCQNGRFASNAAAGKGAEVG